MKTISSQRNIIAYLFILPGLILLMTFRIGPFIASAGLSLFKWPLYISPKWIGIQNYIKLTDDPYFWTALGNTLFFLMGVPIGMVLSLALALLLNQQLRGLQTYRVIYFLPVISSMVAVSVVWRWLYEPNFGIVNYFLSFFGISGLQWLGSTKLAKPALIIVAIWKSTGFRMLIYLAALQGIPQSFHEAAMIDGANSWSRFRKITFPLLSPTNFFLLVMGVIQTFQTFGMVYVMTRGGPAESTTTMVFYIYLNGWEWFRMGYAASIAWVLFFLIFAVTLLQWYQRKKWVFGEM